MTGNTAKTNPMDDYENGVITFDELSGIIMAMPQRELTPAEQSYYWKLSEIVESDDFEISPGGKTYRGEEAQNQGRDLIRRALESQ